MGGEDDHRVAIVIAIVWVQGVIAPLVLAALGMSFSLPTPTLSLLGFVGLVGYSLRPVLVNLRPGDYFFALCVVFAFGSSALMHPGTQGVLADLSPVFFAAVFPMYFLGRAIRNAFLVLRYAYFASILAVGVNVAYTAYYLSSGRALLSDNMDAAYRLLPSVLMIMFVAMREGGLARWAICLLSVTLLLAQGTRGPLLCVGALGVLYLFCFAKRSSRVLVVPAFGIVGSLIVLLGVSLDGFAQWLDGIGLSGRAMAMFGDNELGGANNRDVIYSQVWVGIDREPLWGNGIGGDRLLAQGADYASGTYAHNLVLEVLAQFGYLFGGTLLLSFVYVILRTLVRSGGPHRAFVMVCVAICFKLLMSGSYLEEPFFFLLLGCCVGGERPSPYVNSSTIRSSALSLKGTDW